MISEEVCVSAPIKAGIIQIIDRNNQTAGDISPSTLHNYSSLFDNHCYWKTGVVDEMNQTGQPQIPWWILCDPIKFNPTPKVISVFRSRFIEVETINVQLDLSQII